ncbi:MAG: hypothetical protein LBM62_10200 [Mediterranea sp.]|jgi:hypothetical protein|nr:hypothetical protein [Mediterranea sp.]
MVLGWFGLALYGFLSLAVLYRVLQGWKKVQLSAPDTFEEVTGEPDMESV